MSGSKTFSLNYISVVILSALSGLLSAMSFPSFNLYLLAFISFVPMSVIIYENNLKKTILGFVIYPAVFFGIHFYWIIFYMLGENSLATAALSMAVVILVMIFYYLTAAVIAMLILRKMRFFKGIVLAGIFTILEFLRTTGYLGFPFGILGYTQWKFLPLIQSADIGGIFIIIFLLYYFNAVFARLVIKFLRNELRFSITHFMKNNYEAALLTALLIIDLGYGFYKLHEASTEDKLILKKERAALIQGNYDNNSGWKNIYTGNQAKGSTFLLHPEKIKNAELPGNTGEENGAVVCRRLMKLAGKASVYKPGLYVFSETAILDYYEYCLTDVMKHQDDPGYFLKPGMESYYNSSIIYTGLKKLGAPALLGSPFMEVERNYKVKRYNGILFIGTDGKIIGKYGKIKLVPFGESYPFYKNKWLNKTPPFSYILHYIYDSFDRAGATNWTPWKEYTVFTHPSGDYRFSSLICYEDTFGNIARRFVLHGAQVLFNHSNDSWSYSDSAQEEHFSIAVFRAIENRRDLLRSTDCGLTGHIDAYGRIVKTIPMWRAGCLITDFTPRSTLTFYTLHGDVFVLILALAILLIIMAEFILFKIQYN